MATLSGNTGKQRKKKPRCAVCGSKRFSKDANTGRIICDEGHLLQDYLVESAEREFNPAGLSYRKARKARKPKKQQQPSPCADYKGERSRFLMFQTGQLLLRQQIQAIAELWAIPTELEIVARDLWAVYLSATDLAPEPHNEEAQEQQQQQQQELEDAEAQKHASTADDIDRLFNTTSASETEPQEDDDDDDDDTESEPDEEAHRNDAFLEEQADEVVQRPYAGPTRSRRRGATAREALDPAQVFHAHFTLVLCYLSCLYLRVPVCMHDILELANIGKIPYIGFALTLPKEMRGIMPRAVRSIFMPPSVISVLHDTDESISFHAWVSRFMKLYAGYNIVFPTVNIPPLLAHFTRQLLLPPPFYHATKRLLDRLDYDFHFLSDEPGQKLKRSRADSAKEPSKPLFFYMSLLSPDSIMAGAVLLSIKLHWGLDDRPRHIDSQDAKFDVSREMPTQKAWLKALEEHLKRPSDDDLAGLLNKHVADYNDDELDAFLDHCQSTLVQNERIDGNRAPERFPLSQPKHVTNSEASTQELLRRLHKMYDPKNCMPTMDPQQSDVWRCGEQLAFSAKTRASQPPYRAYATVRDILAQRVGYSAAHLDRATRALEERLVSRMGLKVVRQRDLDQNKTGRRLRRGRGRPTQNQKSAAVLSESDWVDDGDDGEEEVQDELEGSAEASPGGSDDAPPNAEHSAVSENGQEGT